MFDVGFNTNDLISLPTLAVKGQSRSLAAVKTNICILQTESKTADATKDESASASSIVR